VSSGRGIDVLIAQGPFVTKHFAPHRLQNYLAAKLPAYMLPAHYVTLSALPLTANGKVDRQALPIPNEAASLQRSFTAPRTATETQLAALWCDLLRLAEVGIHENFFVLGGDSLLATQVTARLRAQFQVSISLQQFFEAPTVAGLAEQIVISQLSRSFQAASPVTSGDRERGRL
jgi:acyl carrier protein